MLGPTVLGMFQPEWFEALFPPASGAGIVLTGFVQVAVVMLLFIAGLEVDLHIVWQQGRQAVTTSVFGLVIPFSIGFTFPYFYAEFFGINDVNARLTFALFMGTAMAITALPVIVRILMDLNIFRSRMGLLVVASAMVDDLVGWLIFSVILGLIGKGGGSMPLINTVILTIGYAAFMLTIGRGLLNRVLPWVNKKLAWPGGVFLFRLHCVFWRQHSRNILAFTLFSAHLLWGLHWRFGTFF